MHQKSLPDMGVVHELDALRRGGLAGIHDRLAINVAHDGREAAYVVRKRLVETHRGLYLVEIDLASVLDKEIDLEALVIAHEGYIRLKTPVEPRLEDLRNHHVLEKTLAALTGTVNKSSFRGFSSGEVLFRRASGTKRSKKASAPWKVGLG